MPTFLRILLRGARGLCPRCGEARMFERFAVLAKACPRCALPLAGREGDLWAFVYVSAGMVTGVFLATMFWLWRPANLRLGQAIVLVGAVGVLVGSMQLRKGIAVALDYLVDRAWRGEPPTSA